MIRDGSWASDARRYAQAAAWYARCLRRVGASQERLREVSFPRMAGGDHVALVPVSHQDIDRREVENVLRRLYPQHEEPTVAMFPGDAADLGLCRPSDRCDACRMATSRRAAPDGGSRPVIAARPLRTS
jgi:hypothetical protein